jgi:hypothetical protein
MRLFKDNMKFLERLRNSKGTLNQAKFNEFERKQNEYRKNLTEVSNLISNITTGASSHQRSTSVSKSNPVTFSGGHATTNDTSSKAFTRMGGSQANSAEKLPQIGKAANATTTGFSARLDYGSVPIVDSFSEYNMKGPELSAMQKYQQ